MGATVREMKALGMYEQSVMVVISDNGGSVVDGGNNWPLRGAKKSYFQGGVKVPAFVHSPILSAAGRAGLTVSSLVHVSDWVPTLFEGVARNNTPPMLDGKGRVIKDNTGGFDGINLWPMIMGQENFKAFGEGGLYESMPLRTELLHNIDYLDDSTEDGWVSSLKEIPAAITLVSQSDNHTYKMMTGEGSYPWYDASSSDEYGLVYEGTSNSGEENTERTNYTFTRQTSWLFDLTVDPLEVVNLWFDEEYSSIRSHLSDRICYHWANTMVDTVYQSQVSSVDKAAMVTAYKEKGYFITWYRDEGPSTASSFSVSDFERSKVFHGCPLKFAS